MHFTQDCQSYYIKAISLTKKCPINTNDCTVLLYFITANNAQGTPAIFTNQHPDQEEEIFKVIFDIFTARTNCIKINK